MDADGLIAAIFGSHFVFSLPSSNANSKTIKSRDSSVSQTLLLCPSSWPVIVRRTCSTSLSGSDSIDMTFERAGQRLNLAAGQALGGAQGFFDVFPLNRNGGEVSDLFNDLVLLRGWTAGLTRINGKSSEHFFFGGQNWTGPTGLQAVGQRQIAVLGAKGQGGNIGNDYRFSMNGCLGARARAWLNFPAIDRLNKAFGQARSRAMQ